MGLIGFSLSGCVADIMKGNVQECDVDVIFAGTFIKSKDSLQRLIDSYMQTSWRGLNKKKVRALVYRLFYSGKIIQARCIGHRPTWGSVCWKQNNQEFDFILEDFFAFVTKFRND